MSDVAERRAEVFREMTRSLMGQVWTPDQAEELIRIVRWGICWPMASTDGSERNSP